MLGDAAPDHDDLWVESVHEARTQHAHGHIRPLVDSAAGLVARFCGFGNQRGADVATSRGELREDRRFTVFEEEAAIPGDGGTGSERLRMALHPVRAQRAVD